MVSDQIPEIFTDLTPISVCYTKSPTLLAHATRCNACNTGCASSICHQGLVKYAVIGSLLGCEKRRSCSDLPPDSKLKPQRTIGNDTDAALPCTCKHVLARRVGTGCELEAPVAMDNRLSCTQRGFFDWLMNKKVSTFKQRQCTINSSSGIAPLLLFRDPEVCFCDPHSGPLPSCVSSLAATTSSSTSSSGRNTTCAKKSPPARS